jgi:hypothetical protein
MQEGARKIIEEALDDAISKSGIKTIKVHNRILTYFTMLLGSLLIFSAGLAFQFHHENELLSAALFWPQVELKKTNTSNVEWLPSNDGESYAINIPI